MKKMKLNELYKEAFYSSNVDWNAAEAAAKAKKKKTKQPEKVKTLKVKPEEVVKKTKISKPKTQPQSSNSYSAFKKDLGSLNKKIKPYYGAAGTGAALGGLAGALIGDKDNTLSNAVLGAGLGGTSAAFIKKMITKGK